MKRNVRANGVVRFFLLLVICFLGTGRTNAALVDAPKPAGLKTPGREAGATQFYRAQETFEHTTKWLRDHDVKTDKPLHTLRKEFGSIICESADIHTASRQLRHSDLATTAAFYTDHRRRATVPVGSFLTSTIPARPTQTTGKPDSANTKTQNAATSDAGSSPANAQFEPHNPGE